MAKPEEQEMINKLTTKIDNFLEVIAEENKKIRKDISEYNDNLKINIDKINMKIDNLENRIKDLEKEKIYKEDNKEDKNLPKNNTVIYYNNFCFKI